jgi:capsular polysaccharide transport system permease protein
LNSKILKKAGSKIWLPIVNLGYFSVAAFLLVLLISYYGFIASSRYATTMQFLVKEAGAQTELAGLASIGAVTSSTRDSLVIKSFIESRAMAEKLDKKINLRDHYSHGEVDLLSRLSDSATAEEFVEYYQNYILVVRDEMSDVVVLEVQAYTPEYSLMIAESILEISEEFINDLGDKMAQEQVLYAEKEVERAHEILKSTQSSLLEFQEKNKLFNPEQEGGAILSGINELQMEIIKAEARLKELDTFFRGNSTEIKSQENLIYSLRSQLVEERNRLTADEQGAFNKVSMNYKELVLGNEMAVDLYRSSLVSLDVVRSQALQKLKHLLIVEPPLMPEEDKYPKRVYNILTWFVVMSLVYLMIRMIFTIISEHKE